MKWEDINRKRLPFVVMGERLFRGMYGEIRKAYFVEINAATDRDQLYDIASSVDIDNEMVMAAMEKFYTRTGIAFASDLQKSYHGNKEIKEHDEWLAEIMEYVATKTGNKITNIIKTHYNDIENIARSSIETGITEGWGMKEIATEIMKRQKEIDLWKAMRIARTEVVAASNMGVKIGASELPGSKIKVWISAFDSRSREDHMAMDGVRVPYMDPFVTPSGNQLDYPGDPDCADPADIINCRCGYEIIVEPEIY